MVRKPGYNPLRRLIAMVSGCLWVISMVTTHFVGTMPLEALLALDRDQGLLG